MSKRLINQTSINSVESAVHHNARRGGLLDIRYGFSLLLSRHVPVLRKLAALSIGALLAAVLIALEFPFETLVGGLLNLFGVGLDVVLDGFEVVVGPILFAALLMPRMVRIGAGAGNIAQTDLVKITPPG